MRLDQVMPREAFLRALDRMGLTEEEYRKQVLEDERWAEDQAKATGPVQEGKMSEAASCGWAPSEAEK